MEIRRHMISPVRSVRPGDSIADAARVMERFDVGALIVLDQDELVGIVTDRDIVVRCLAPGLNPDLPVRRIMTGHVVFVRDTAWIDDVLEKMTAHGVRRLPVCGAAGEVVGIISIGDLAAIDWDKNEIGTTLGNICKRRPIASRPPVSA